MGTQAASTIEVSEQAPNAPRRNWSLLAAEFIIGLLWLAGSIRYLRQKESYALLLLALALGLLLPRLASLIVTAFKPAAEYRLAMWMFLLGMFLPEHLATAGKVVSPQIVPLLLAGICLAVQTIAAHDRNGMESFISRIHPARWLTWLTVVYFIVGCALAIGKLHAFGYVGQDIGYFMQCLYTGLHGKLFASNQYHDLLYTRTVSSDFAGHNQPVLFLLLPIYWLYPHAETLFLVRNIVLAVSAYPAYQLARLYLDELSAAIVTAAFLLAPAVLFQNFYDYAPLSLVGLPLLFAMLFYYRRSYLPYLASLVLCLFVREDLVFVAMGMGIVALLSRRKLAWSIVPLAIGACWSVITWRVILPQFQQGAVSAVSNCFSYLGSTPLEMLRTAAHHPQLVMTHKAVVYLKQVFTPEGMVLPFWSPASAIALWYLLINVLGDPGCNAAIVFRHYSLIPSILLLPGTVLAVRWLAARQSLRHLSPSLIATLLLLASAGTTALSIGEAEINWLRQQSWQDEARQVAAALPPTAAAAVPRYMLPLTSNRDLQYQALRLLDYHHPDADYIVIDRDRERMGVTAEWQPHYDELLSELSERDRFSEIYVSDNYEVFKRTGAPFVSLRPEVK